MYTAKPESLKEVQTPQFHPGKIPETPVIWPVDQHAQNQIQQLKISAKPQSTFTLPTSGPGAAAVPPRTTPGKVSNVRIVSRPGSGQKTVTVQFNHPPGDQYYMGSNVYLRQANGQPTLVAKGTKSPITFTVPTSTAPHSIFVTSVGNWGETDVLSSPSAPVRLK